MATTNFKLGNSALSPQAPFLLLALFLAPWRFARVTDTGLHGFCLNTQTHPLDSRHELSFTHLPIQMQESSATQNASADGVFAQEITTQ